MYLKDVTLLGVVEQRGTRDNGEKYAYDQYHVLDGLVVHKCRMADSVRSADFPGEGEVFSAEVSVTPWDFNGSLGLAVRILGIDKPGAYAAASAE